VTQPQQQQQQIPSASTVIGAELAASSSSHSTPESKGQQSVSTAGTPESPSWSDEEAAVYDVTPAPAKKTAQVGGLRSIVNTPGHF
jgi:hypothetical protein